jgi:hypothetical protein
LCHPPPTACQALEALGAEVVSIPRGGEVTWHGPGQLVAYPLVGLRRAALGVRGYVEALEDGLVGAAGAWGLAVREGGGAGGKGGVRRVILCLQQQVTGVGWCEANACEGAPNGCMSSGMQLGMQPGQPPGDVCSRAPCVMCGGVGVWLEAGRTCCECQSSGPCLPPLPPACYLHTLV